MRRQGWSAQRSVAPEDLALSRAGGGSGLGADRHSLASRRLLGVDRVGPAVTLPAALPNLGLTGPERLTWCRQIVFRTCPVLATYLASRRSESTEGTDQ